MLRWYQVIRFKSSRKNGAQPMGSVSIKLFPQSSSQLMQWRETQEYPSTSVLNFRMIAGIEAKVFKRVPFALVIQLT